MARDVDDDTLDELSGEKLSPIGLVELEFDSGAFRVWTGIGDLEWDGETWTGVGDLGSISAIEETTEVRAVGVQLELSGIPSEVIAIANEQDWQGRPARIYYAVLQGRTFVGEPFKMFQGLMDQMTLVEGDQAAIRIACESSQIDLERTRVRRYTAEDQRAEYAGDKGLDQVAALQEVEILWGRS